MKLPFFNEVEIEKNPAYQPGIYMITEEMNI